MPKAKKVKVEEVVEVPAAAVAEVEAAPEAEVKGSVSVYTKSGAFVRSYSKDEHGPEYKKLAAGYASKIGGVAK